MPPSLLAGIVGGAGRQPACAIDISTLCTVLPVGTQMNILSCHSRHDRAHVICSHEAKRKPKREPDDCLLVLVRRSFW